MSTGTGLVTYTVQDLITAIRATLGSSNQNNLSNAQIIAKINEVWQFELVQEFTNFSLCSMWTFMTIPGVDKYIFPQGNALNMVKSPLLNNAALTFYDSNRDFFNNFVGTLQNYIIATADGTTNTYSLQLGQQITRGYKDILGVPVPAVTITAIGTNKEQQVLYDYGTGILTDGGSGSGAINYYTGETTVQFAVNVEGNIFATFDNSSWTRPVACLFYNNVLTLRPVPNQPYFVQAQVQYIPAPFTAVSDTLPISTLFHYLHYQTALLIALEINDNARVTFIEPRAQKAKLNVERITYRQNDNRRRSNQFYNPQAMGNTYPYMQNPYPPSVS